MFIFRKLIILEWLKGFSSATFILYMLVTVSNLIAGFTRSSVTAQEVIFGHIIETPTFLGMILPISCLVASMFSINKLKNRNELTAIFSLGYSRQSFIGDIFQVAVVIACLQFLVTGYIDPLMKRNRAYFIDIESSKLSAFESQGLSSSTLGSGKIWYRTQDYFFSFTAFDKQNNQLKDIDLYYVNDDQLISKIIKAEQATHQNENKWLFDNIFILEDLDTKKFPIQTNKDQTIIELNERPEDFLQIEADITTLPIGQLYGYIQKLKNAGINTSEYEVLYYSKYSSSLICVIFSLIAAIGIFNPNRRTSSFGQNIAFVFIFTLLYWLVYSYTLELGNSSKINPILACFIVPSLFSGFLVFFYIRHRKLR